jgi:hypothetical protein
MSPATAVFAVLLLMQPDCVPAASASIPAEQPGLSAVVMSPVAPGISGAVMAPSRSNEDLLLAPESGNAVLHLDVPFSTDVDVTVWRASGGEPIHHLVRGRGRHRDLLISGLGSGSRQAVDVYATWRGDAPAGEAYWSRLKRTVWLQAGDRRFLTIRESEFEKEPASPSPVVPCVAAAAASPAAAKKQRAAARTTAPASHVFRFEGGTLTAFVAYPKEAAAGGRSQSFTFAKAGKTPDLDLSHAPPNPESRLAGASPVTVTVRLTVTWGKPKQPVSAVAVTTIPLSFSYPAGMPGTAKVPFNADGPSVLRQEVEAEVAKLLSVLDRPATMTMTGQIEIGLLRFPVQGVYKIVVKAGEPAPRSGNPDGAKTLPATPGEAKAPRVTPGEAKAPRVTPGEITKPPAASVAGGKPPAMTDATDKAPLMIGKPTQQPVETRKDTQQPAKAGKPAP